MRFDSSDARAAKAQHVLYTPWSRTGESVPVARRSKLLGSAAAVRTLISTASDAKAPSCGAAASALPSASFSAPPVPSAPSPSPALPSEPKPPCPAPPGIAAALRTWNV